MNQQVLSVCGVLVIAVTYFVVNDLGNPTVRMLKHQSEGAQKQASLSSGQAPADEMTMSEIARASFAASADWQLLPIGQAEASLLSANQPAAWRIGSNVSLPGFAIDKNIKTKAAIELDLARMQSVRQGDHFALPLPGSNSVHVKVDQVDVLINGDFRWQGYLAGYQDSYPVVFTLGMSTAFASITTPNGSYTVESVGSSGWVYANPQAAELDQQDVIEAPHSMSASYNTAP